MDESSTDEVECSGRRVSGASRSLVNARGLQLESGLFFTYTRFFYVFTYGSKKMIRRKKKRSRIRAVQMDNLSGFLGIRRMDKILNTRMKQLCGMTKGVDENIDEGVL